MGGAPSLAYSNYKADLLALQQWLDSHPIRSGKQGMKAIDRVIEAYKDRAFIPLSRKAILENTTFIIKESGVAYRGQDPDNRIGLKLESPSDMVIFRRVTEPLMDYLLRARTSYNTFLTSPEGKYFNLDTKKERKNIGARVDISTRIISDKMPEVLFDWFVHAIKSDISSDGIRAPITPALRQAVSAENCFCCHQKLGPNWQVGHVKSVETGGMNDLRDLRPVCQACNNAMGKQHMEEYMIRINAPGAANIPEARAKLWRAIVALTNEVAVYEPAVKQTTMQERMLAIDKALQKLLR